MEAWRAAFAEQALADHQLYEHLCTYGGPQCHRFHYLQMWLEKLTKVFLSREILEKRQHQVVRAWLYPNLVSNAKRLGYPSNAEKRARELRVTLNICRQVDLLHPQVDDNGRRPDNTEYPWLDNNGWVVAPVNHHFSELNSLLSTNNGTTFLRAMRELTVNWSKYSPAQHP